MFIRKIGRNRGKPRLWIEGAELVRAGFEVGVEWRLVTVEGCLAIERVELHAENATTVTVGRVRKIAGTTERPIVDIAGGSLDPLRDDSGQMPTTVKITCPVWGQLIVKGKNV